MFRRLGVVLAVAVCAVAAAAGTARADTSSWCGQATCDASSTLYIACSDGTVWALDPEWADADTYGQVFCDGSYSVLQPPDPSDQGDNTGDGGNAGTFDLSASMAPDPSLYITEVQCPNGQIWAVASGDDFVCPAA